MKSYYSLDTFLRWQYKALRWRSRSAISYLPLRGNLRDGPTKRDALLLESYMLTLSRAPHVGIDLSRSAGALADHTGQPRPRWMNFNICPHCLAHGRLGHLERLDEWGPMIFRSDGRLFHLVLGDKPIEYPQEKGAGRSDMKSVGFWYLHEGNGSTETVVVILRRPPRAGDLLLRHLELLADKLFEKLRKSSRLPCLYEFDGQDLRQVVY